jgi:hypothetical protein
MYTKGGFLGLSPTKYEIFVVISGKLGTELDLDIYPTS